MRRPHVYERSAPRVPRSAYQEPQVNAASTARQIAIALAMLLSKAELSGLHELADSLRHTLDEAELTIRTRIRNAVSDAAADVDRSDDTDIEGLMRVLDAAPVRGQLKG